VSAAAKELRRIAERLGTERAALKASNDALRNALDRLLNDPDCAKGAELGGSIARLYVKTADVKTARALLDAPTTTTEKDSGRVMPDSNGVPSALSVLSSGAGSKDGGA
jgi:hypothetical protein